LFFELVSSEYPVLAISCLSDFQIPCSKKQSAAEMTDRVETRFPCLFSSKTDDPDQPGKGMLNIEMIKMIKLGFPKIYPL